MITSALMYLLYAKAKKGKLYAFIIGFVLYAVDFSLVFSIHYYEGATGIIVSNFIHLMILLYFVVVGLLFLLKNPRWRTRYDYA
jgi:heme/copper-type cytochrome/quinol oxidase subunit 4